MTTSLRTSLALLCTALLGAQAAADIRIYNPENGHTTVTPTRPATGDLFESAVTPVPGAGTPYKPGIGAGATDLIGSVIYSQPPAVLDGGGFFSDAVPGQFYDQKIGDNFVTPGSHPWALTGVRWWGASEAFAFPDYTNMTSFTVELFADAGGAPGTSLTGPLVYPTAATSPTVVGIGFAGQDVYVQEVHFPGVVVVPGGTAAWLSVSATLADPFGDAWVWNFSAPADGVVAAEIPVGAPWATFVGFGEESFEILAYIPEPGSAVLASLGALAMGVVAGIHCHRAKRRRLRMIGSKH